MAGYPVHRLKGTKRRVVVVQYPGLDTGATVLVPPLYPMEKELVLDVVTPIVTLDGEDYLVAMHLLAAVRSKELGSPEATLPAGGNGLGRAINRLFFGI